ncbi:extracellular solute-binding protein [Paenibacillus daejeonensis]|uniref:extracellular solute-binding protein n=1 Tax=Paenibacillus daejeonensis TaxID=135193 RepID=UPI00035DEF0B|nr:extracellular solute-binding protein [Paenibacillus daejeonensis]
MKTMRKSVSFMLASLVVLVTILAACSGGNNEGTTGGESDPNVKKDPITVSMYDRGNVPPEVGTVDNNLWTQWINETVPVEYVPVPRWESVQRFNTLLAAGDAPDLILEYDNAYRNQLYLQKQLMPIEELIEQHSVEYKALLEEFPLLRQLGTKSDGQLYEFGRLLGYIPGGYLFIREDLLEAAGLEVPQTVEEAYEAMKKVKADQLATFGTNMSGYNWMDVAFQNTTWVLEDGDMVKDWERVAAATQYKKQLFDEGLIDRDFMTDKNGEKALQDFVQGNTFMFGFAGNALLVYNNYETLKSNVPDAKLAVIPLPRSEFGQFSPYFNDPVQMTGVVNIKAEDPESVMRYVDLMSSDSMAHTLKYGQEGVHYEMVDGVEQTLDQDKYEKEVSWLGDYRMLGGQHIINEFTKYLEDLDQSDPFDKEVHTLLETAFNLYIDRERPLPEVTKYMPGLPDDIQFVVSNVNEPMSDLWSRAIVGGSNATVDKTLEEAKTLWSRSDGEQVEQFYLEWYRENKDTWVFTEDLYDMNF